MAGNPPHPPHHEDTIIIDSDSSVDDSADGPLDMPRSPIDLRRSPESIWEWPSQDRAPDVEKRSSLTSLPSPEGSAGDYEGCLQAMIAVFPDISHQHVRDLWDKTEQANFTQLGALHQHLIERILDQSTYPKERDRLKQLRKRKRSSPEAEAAKWKFAHPRHDQDEYAKVAKARLSERFDMVPIKFIHDTFKEHSHFYGAFFAIEEAERTRDDTSGQPFQRLKSKRVSNVKSGQLMAGLEVDGHSFANLREEMQAAETRWQKAEDDRKTAKERITAKAASDEEYRRKGETMECACCFSDDNPLTDMTHCNADAPHFFCFACARRNAEHDMTSLKYSLRCMDQSSCDATFGRDQRARFLDDTTIEKLEQLQQQDEIRRAELGDLEACPYCEYVAIYPPAEVVRVFDCQNPLCMEASCRHCKEKAHIPLSCEEARKENGIEERHVIEEARTLALIRSCKKCNVRILKEDGCNKVICTNCRSVLCDYCGEDISKTKYEHFDPNPRGCPMGERTAKKKCPLYDSFDRKDAQIEQAGKAAMEKVRAENPDLSEEDLKIKFAKAIEGNSTRLQGMLDADFVRFEDRLNRRRAHNEGAPRRMDHIAFDAAVEMRAAQGFLQEEVGRYGGQNPEQDAQQARYAPQLADHQALPEPVQAPFQAPRFPRLLLGGLPGQWPTGAPIFAGPPESRNVNDHQAPQVPFRNPENDPLYLQRVLSGLERPRAPLAGDLGSTGGQREQAGRDLPTERLSPESFSRHPTRRDQRREEGPVSEGHRRALERHRRLDNLRPNQAGDFLTGLDRRQSSAGGSNQLPGDPPNLEQPNPGNLAEQNFDDVQEVGARAGGLNVPLFNRPAGPLPPFLLPHLPLLPPQHLGNVIDARTNLVPEPAGQRPHDSFWHVDQNVPYL